jgi:hypothetical protein
MVAEPAGAHVERIEYPPVQRELVFSEQAVGVYGGEILVGILFKDEHRRGDESIELAVEYQACTDNACLVPVTRRLTVGLT